MDEPTQLIRFAEQAQGLDAIQRLKLILFVTGIKPNTYVVLKIHSHNLEEKHHFEEHLRRNKIMYEISHAKSYEEITAIHKNKIHWTMQGTWQGYDLFSSKKSQQKFKKYKQLLKQQKHAAADTLAGKLYNYPPCCVREYTKEHDTTYLKKKYGYYTFYQRMHETEKKFPFIVHYPCSPHCRATQQSNKKYTATIKKYAPMFFKEYTRKHTFTTDLIIDSESDIYDDNAHPLWPEKDGHEYSLVSLTPFQGHYYLFSHLTKTLLLRGSIVSARITMHHNYADVKITALKDYVPDIHHERKFLVPP